MKFVAANLPLLFVSILATSIDESNLRGSDIHNRELAYAERKQGWLAAHNSRREKYHIESGGKYSPIAWSNALKREAAKLAKSMSINQCTLEMPQNMVNGFNLSARKGYPRVPTTEWVVKQWESDIDDESKNGSIRQVLWSATGYVGCADSYNNEEKCSVTVCLYAKVSVLLR